MRVAFKRAVGGQVVKFCSTFPLLSPSVDAGPVPVLPCPCLFSETSAKRCDTPLSQSMDEANLSPL